MSEHAWKAFERRIADTCGEAMGCGGKRGWANSGESFDVAVPDFTSPRLLVQCKLVKKMSAAELARLIYDGRAEVTKLAKQKQFGRHVIAAVAYKLPRSQKPVILLTMEDFARLLTMERLGERYLSERKAVQQPPLSENGASHS